MSGIFACFDPTEPVTDATITAMLTTSDYWRPDDKSLEISRDGHCRMARAALFNTAQSKLEAVHRDDAGNLISANARLDNRGELAAALGLTADQLAGMADGALILAAYHKWSESCPKHLLGDFAFIIWDEARHRLFCARDHFGVKVLFYARTRLGWRVTNEHSALFTDGAMEKQIDEAWLAEKLWGLTSAGSFASPYIGIEVLPPAHTLTIDTNGAKCSRYWSLQEKHDWDGMDDETLIELLGERFKEAVRVRLESTFPLAAELSEGLDSNGIAGHTARMLGEQPLFTLSYNCAELSDDNHHIWGDTYRDIFEMLAMHDNLRPVWYKPSQTASQEAQRDTEAFYRHSGDLLSTRGGHFLRSRLAGEQGARVLLSGWGGDHCVSAYGDFYESELLRRGRLLTLHRLLKRKHARERCGKPFKSWGHLLLKHVAPPLYHGLLRRRGGLEKALWQRAATHPLKAEFIERYRLRHALKRFTDGYQRHSVKSHHRRELFEIGVEGRLVDSELCGRMFRVEYRYPMLDVPLVELAYNMPSHLKIRDGMERYMFRRVLEGVTTKRIQWRQKADVSHPNFDRDTLASQDGNELLEKLRGSELVTRYCDEEKLESLAGTGVEGMMLLGRFQLLLDIEQRIADGDSLVVETTASR